MLSSEGSRLARLILSRHTLICRAVELDSKFEAISLLQLAQAGVSVTEPTSPRGAFSQYRRRLSAELTMLPALLDDLEQQISQAWRRLETVSPKISG